MRLYPRVVKCVAGAAVVVMVGGCSGPTRTAESESAAGSTGIPDAPASSEVATPSLDNYVDQQIDWAPCPDRPDADCGSIDLPVDYANPDNASISMPLIRLAATDPDNRIGVLTTNPGGPGESGYETVLTADDDPGLARLRERYDLIGWDPRGVGRTAGIQCLSDEEIDAYLATDFSPVDDEGRQQVAEAQRRYADGCLRNAGDLLAFVGTEFVVNDMDLLRSALGEDTLNYMGYSYGTLIGQLYAQQFPDRVGRMALDSIDDPQTADGHQDYDSAAVDTDPDPGTPGDLSESDKHVDEILDACAAEAQCPLGQDPKTAERRLDELVAKVRTDPIPLPDGRMLGVNLVLTAAFQATYQEEYGPLLTQGIADAFNGDGAKLAKLADDYVGRDPTGHYTHKQDAFWSVQCMAGDPAVFRTQADDELMPKIDRVADAARSSSPLFGENDTYSGSLCSFWKLPPTRKAEAVVVKAAPPILVINNIGDTVTNVDNARRVADNLDGSVLVLNDRDDHIAFGKGSDCVDDIVINYFFDGTLPPPGMRCSRS
jgi:pimeloyl-ACP methyl ester carboxylesterase